MRASYCVAVAFDGSGALSETAQANPAGPDTLVDEDQEGTFPMGINDGAPAFIIVSARDVARRAYEIYVARGRDDGFDREDWLRAERELKGPHVRDRLAPRTREPLKSGRR